MSVTRIPSATYVVARTVHDQELAEGVIVALRDAGWRLVPARPTQRNGAAPMEEGMLTTRQLISAAEEFDTIDDDLFSASDFVAWLVVEVRGSPEWKWMEAKRR